MNIYLLVDTSRSMAEGNAGEDRLRKRVAAALGYIGLKNLDRVGGAAFSSTLHTPLNLGRGRKQILRLFGFLAGLSCSGATDLRGAIHTFTKLVSPCRLGRDRQRSLRSRRAGAPRSRNWRGKNYQVLLIHIVDEAGNAAPPAGDVALVDVEAGSERRFFLDAELVRRFSRSWRLFLARSKRLREPQDRLSAHHDASSLRRVRPEIAAPGEQRGLNLCCGDCQPRCCYRRGRAADPVFSTVLNPGIEDRHDGAVHLGAGAAASGRWRRGWAGCCARTCF